MKYLIVGGVAGGASTAARLRRIDEHAEIIMFEKGPYVSYANCGLPYYIGEVIEQKDKLLLQTPQTFKDKFNVDVRIHQEVTAINATKKYVTVTNFSNGKEYNEPYDKLILSPGAEPIKPPLPGLDLPGIFTLRNVPDTEMIKSFADKYKGGKAIVIGAGFIGLEMAENLHHIGMDVTIVEMANQVLVPVDYPIAAILQQHLRSKGIGLMLNQTVSGFEQENSSLQVLLQNGNKLAADIVILSIGVRPDVKLAQAAGLTIGNNRGIWVNEFLQTSNEHIYALGDAIEFTNPITGLVMNTYLAGPANKQARIVADNIVSGNKRSYNGSINTAIVKVFDFTVATTGMSAKHLDKLGMPYMLSTTRSGSHATYYPHAKQLTIQIVFEPNTGKLLGAQAVGMEGVDKRIDIIATLIQRGGSIYDLSQVEHAYAPPFSSAKDPVNIAGNVAENLLQQLFKVVYWQEILPALKANTDAVLIDVRSAQEFAQGHIEGAINIPVENIRGSLTQLNPAHTYYVYCAIGLRGYLVQRILRQYGFNNVYNLSGGYFLWHTAIEEMHKTIEFQNV